MNDLIDSENSSYPISVRIILSEGSCYNQPLEIDSDGAQCFMDWFRDKKSDDIWTWKIPSEQKIKMFNRRNIVAVEIDGYIEPDGKDSKWHQRLADKFKSRLFLFIHKRMWDHDKVSETRTLHKERSHQNSK